MNDDLRVVFFNDFFAKNSRTFTVRLTLALIMLFCQRTFPSL